MKGNTMPQRTWKRAIPLHEEQCQMLMAWQQQQQHQATAKEVNFLSQKYHKQNFIFHLLTISSFLWRVSGLLDQWDLFLGLMNHCPWWLKLVDVFVKLSLSWTCAKVLQFRECKYIFRCSKTAVLFQQIGPACFQSCSALQHPSKNCFHMTRKGLRHAVLFEWRVKEDFSSRGKLWCSLPTGYYTFVGGAENFPGSYIW